MPFADPAARRAYDRDRKREYRRDHPGKGRGSSGRSGNKRRFDVGRFVGVDGEGMTGDDGVHRYVYLASSDGDELTRRGGIPTAEFCAFLLGIAKRDPRAILVCFGAGYDVNMGLGDLARREVADLWAGRAVDWRQYRLSYRPRKALSLHEGPPTFVRRGQDWSVKWRAGATLWDVFGFFQSSFLEAMTKWLPPAELERYEYARIAAGKARRSQFALDDLPEIRRYTGAELRALVALMELLRDHLREAGLVISRWDGAGAVAAAMLQTHEIKEAIGPDPLPEVERAAQHAYAGGRIEIARYGTRLGPVHHYDLNSAYPAAMLDLPALRGGSWQTHEPCHRSASGFALVRVRWSLAMRGDAAEAFPFFYRERYGDISYPARGRAWCWWPEYEAAHDLIRAGVYHGDLAIERAFCFHPADRSRPFAWVAEMYERRRALKRAGSGAEKVLKLGLNSLYGKLAQQVGYGGERAKRRPPFHSLLYAGYITAATRARLLRAAMQRPRALVMFATDAVYTDAVLDLETGEGLGQWSAVRHVGLVVVQSGVYWTRDAAGDFVRETEYRRGFDAGSLTSDAIRRAWTMRQREYEASATRFVTMGSALDSGDDPSCQDKGCPDRPRLGPLHKVFDHWRTWRTIPRGLRLDPENTKRERIRGAVLPHKGLVPTRARSIPDPSEPHEMCPTECTGSHPYPLRWRGEELAQPQIDGTSERVLEWEMAESAL